MNASKSVLHSLQCHLSAVVYYVLLLSLMKSSRENSGEMNGFLKNTSYRFDLFVVLRFEKTSIPCSFFEFIDVKIFSLTVGSLN